MADGYDWPFHDDYERTLRRWEREVKRGLPPRVVRWTASDHSGLGYWLRYLAYDHRGFAHAAPRRLACRLLRRHNITCHGRPDCKRFAPKAMRIVGQAVEYVLSPDAVARAAAATPLQELCCGCSGDTCCTCGTDPCSTS